MKHSYVYYACTVVLASATSAVLAQQPDQSAPPLGAAPATAAPQVLYPTNTGQSAPLIFTGHVLGSERTHKLPQAEVQRIRQEAATAPVSVPEGVQPTNGGKARPVAFTGHHLSSGADSPGGILYAPSEDDSPAFRAALAACTGGVVDYYDARVGTPSAALLSTYDCVLTWADFAYADPALFGDHLAAYVDAGGKAILGQWCYQSDQSHWLEGLIMTSAYCPVTVDSSYNSGAYAGDGADCVHLGPPSVTAYDTSFLDNCTLVSGAQSDGTFDDGGTPRISVAWRNDRRVYYSAGNTGTFYGTGDWAELTCNICECVRSGGGLLYAPTDPDNPAFRLAVAQLLGVPVDYFDARVATPTLALLSNYDCVLTWVDFAYADNVAFGDVLADYVDNRGRVILGQWCLQSDQVYWLEGRIMTPAYCPITATSTSYGSGAYNGDGIDCVHIGVAAYDTSYLDVVTALAAGATTDGTFDYSGNPPAVIWRHDRRVYYSAGNTGGTLGSGEWDKLTANMCSLHCVCASAGAPLAQLDAPPELGDGCACDIVNLTGTASDPDATLDSYTLEYREVGSGSWTVIGTGSTDVVGGLLGTWDTTALPQGYYLVRLTVTNICGYSSSAVRSVFVDQVYDTLSWAYPGPGSVVAGNVCFTGTVFESWCGSEYTVSYRAGGVGAWLPVDPGTPVYSGTVVNSSFASWNTTGLGLADGSYQLRVVASNDCGHTQSATRFVTLDNTAPTATIAAPTSCAVEDGLVDITGTAFDTNIDSWTLQYTGGSSHGWTTLASGTTNIVGGLLYTWDVSALPDCAYTLRLLVSDDAVVNCGPFRHQTEYLTSILVGPGFVLPGDLNCDGLVNAFDIDPFVHCLTTGDCDCP
jgi:hypothetical protein